MIALLNQLSFQAMNDKAIEEIKLFERCNHVGN